MTTKKADILIMESHLQPGQPYPRIKMGGSYGHGYLSPLAGDEIELKVADGDTWEAFWIGGTNVSETDSMKDYDIYIPGTKQVMVEGQEFEYHLGGDAVVFTDPIIGPANFKMKKRAAALPRIKTVLLPRQHGHHVFSEQVLQELLADAVGKTHSLKNLIAVPHEYSMYTKATVVEAELTDKGIEALVELGW